MSTNLNLSDKELARLINQEVEQFQSGPSQNGGSASNSDGIEICSVCGKECKGKFGLQAHMKAHDKPTATKEPDLGNIPVKKAAKPSQKELREIQEELGQNIETVGQVLHGIFFAGKYLKLQDPNARFAIPNTKIDFPIPDFDTHLPLTLISRSALTAELLVKYAESNETLLKWLVRFNSWFKGGQSGSLVGAHVVAAASSFGINPPMLGMVSSALIPDVLQQVQQENNMLRAQLAQSQAEVIQLRQDERGSGN